MHLLTILYLALLALFSLTPNPSLAAKVPKNAVLLSQVKSLTLRSGAQTSHRRVPAVPQLTCKGPGCAYYKVDVMRCINAGSGYGAEDIEWSCTATLPVEFKLGSTDVACEGYSSRDDPYVLKGSCGVEYRLLLTDKGEERYGYGKGGWGGGVWGNKGKGLDWAGFLFFILFVGVLGWIVYSAFAALDPAAPGAAPRRLGGGWGGGWGGGGGGGGGGGPPYDPPPPYPGSKPNEQPEVWRPGFWTGAGLGAGAGYLAGQRGREREPLYRQPQRAQRAQEGSNSWPGGNNNNNNRWNSNSGRSDSAGSSSSARHESTGFGSTSRR